MNYYLPYAAVLAVVILLYLKRNRRAQDVDRHELKQALDAGLGEPPSLHPVVDPARCIGSGSCARACPEEALGVVDGKAVLKNGSACPVEAISLVFGTEKRGIDIPNISPHFETNVPGIFIAGELGCMGLVRKAAEQGRQACRSRAVPRSAGVGGGGGDSALEAAISLADQPGTGVILSYRSAAFSRVKGRNRDLLAEHEQAGRIQVLLTSSVKSIEVRSVTIVHDGMEQAFPNDAVIVCAGGELPTPLLKKIGIEFETKFGSR